jgi:hypothetical protein
MRSMGIYIVGRRMGWKGPGVGDLQGIMCLIDLALSDLNKGRGMRQTADRGRRAIVKFRSKAKREG